MRVRRAIDQRDDSAAAAKTQSDPPGVSIVEPSVRAVVATLVDWSVVDGV
jgi:hypothetical protein